MPKNSIEMWNKTSFGRAKKVFVKIVIHNRKLVQTMEIRKLSSGRECLCDSIAPLVYLLFPVPYYTCGENLTKKIWSGFWETFIRKFQAPITPKVLHSFRKLTYFKGLICATDFVWGKNRYLQFCSFKNIFFAIFQNQASPGNSISTIFYHHLLRKWRKLKEKNWSGFWETQFW